MAVVDVIVNSVHSIYSNSVRINLTINLNLEYDGNFISIASRYLGPGSFQVGWQYYFLTDPAYTTTNGTNNGILWDNVSGPGSINVDVRAVAPGGFPEGDLQIIFQVGAQSNPQFQGITPVFQKGVGTEPPVNTGMKAYATLEEYYTDDNSTTGQTKANSIGSPDYVPPVSDSTSCPIGQP